MKRKRAAIAIAGIITVAFAVVSNPTFSANDSIKELMADNFARMQRILASLITSNYQAVPGDLDVIREHAKQLPDMIPASAKDQETMFFSYASNLNTHADYLKFLIELLIEHDEQRTKSGKLSLDVLRDSAAAHYGAMIQMCVACHNRFRLHVVR